MATYPLSVMLYSVIYANLHNVKNDGTDILPKIMFDEAKNTRQVKYKEQLQQA